MQVPAQASVFKARRRGCRGHATELDLPPRVTTKAWIKHKLRRGERLTVTGIRRRPDGSLQGLPDGPVHNAILRHVMTDDRNADHAAMLQAERSAGFLHRRAK
jgi:hypothetical protein